MNRRLIFQGFLALLGVLTLAELGFSNLNTLLTDLESTAADFGLSPGAERIRLVVLIVFDGIAAGGSFLALVGFRRGETTRFRRGLLITLAGFLAYGLYQIASSQLQLAAEYRMAVTGAGLTYAALGVLAYALGQRFLDDGELRTDRQ